MAVLGLEGSDYAKLIGSRRGAGELAELVESLRVGETRFFRHEPQVDAVVAHVLPLWKKQGKTSPRVWSAGCASGEEAYTLALVLAGEMPAPAFSPSIYASDVSKEALAFAARGTYPRSAI